MFTFIIILILCALCFITYGYFSNKTAMYKKQIMLLTRENSKLKNKIRNLSESKFVFENEEKTEEKDDDDINPNI